MKDNNSNTIWVIFVSVVLTLCICGIIELISIAVISFPCINNDCKRLVKYEYKYCPYCGHQYRTDNKPEKE